MFYSKTTGGFYTAEVHGDKIPADSVEITIEEAQSLRAMEAEGKRIVANENGYPIIVDWQPSTDDLAYFERSWRNSELVRADNEIRRHQDADKSATATEQAWRDYRVNLRSWPENPDFPNISSRPAAPTD